MAKAVFHRNQKVWVESVGAWAVIEKIVPVWARGFEEPIRVTYDVGLGREFQAHELKAEDDGDGTTADGASWRLLRARNKWQSPEETGHHPYPGTYPVIVTDPNDWGGWRVPGAEYDRDPRKIEHQARLIAVAPHLLTLMRELTLFVSDAPEDAPVELRAMVERAKKIERYLNEVPGEPEPSPVRDVA